jgi:hypothetical protein
LLMVLVTACHSLKNTTSTDKSNPKVIPQDTMELYRQKGLQNSLDEKLLPAFKSKADSIKQNK